MKYLVRTHCLEWHNVGYVVEANSKREARELVEDYQEGDIYYDNYDTTDQIEIETVEPYED